VKVAWFNKSFMKLPLFIFFLIISEFCFSQKEANNWYFGFKAGISFQDGYPSALLDNAMDFPFGTSSISDSAGNLLFYTNGENVYNKKHQQMPNGFGLLGDSQSQTSLIIKKPGSYKEYYLFTVGSAYNQPFIGLHYSIIDMNKQGGMGDVDNLIKNIPLNISDLAVEKITAVKHIDNESVWVIVRNLTQPINEYHSYLITSNGVNHQPIKTSCVSNIAFSESGSNSGQMKVSPDGKLLVSAIYTLSGGPEIGQFDNESGNILNLIHFDFIYLIPWGVEFSSDSRFVYFSNKIHGSPNRIFQYELSLLPDLNAFMNSAIDIGLGGNASDIQIGLDGKIYVARRLKDYLGVINNPSLKGIACDYDSLGVYLGGKICNTGLPQFIQTYFLRFEYEGECAGENFIFTPNFNPVPDSIHWDFGDPGSGANNTSNELNPAHIYSQSGIFTVTAFVRYPDGRTETAIREVTVTALPQPYPHSDTLICKGSSVSLQAESGFDSYLWSDNQTTDFIMVSDTGSYWVEAVNADGCIGRDTVHVGWHPLPQLTTDTIISPTTCGNSIGAITGVNIIGGTPPYNVFWLNSIGDTIGTTNNLYNLGVDNYELWVTDDSGCNNLIASFPVQNFDSHLIITNVIPKDTRCSQPLGELDVQVQSGLTDRLFYSIDNWATYQTNGSFTGLLPDSYYVKVKDSLGCEAVYAGNPVYINDNPGPQATASSLPATGSNPNGSITLTATGFGNLTYSLNGGTPQSSGEFTGLIAGTYTWRVEDENGCFTEGSIEVGQEAGFIISAIAGNSAVCLGNAPVAPLLIENFTGVQAFTATLEYDATLVNCEGFRPGSVHPQLETNLIAEVYPASQRIVVTWAGSAPLTLTGTVNVLDLVFSATQAGNSFLTWDQAPAATWFTGEYGSIEPEFQIGQIQVNNPPVLAQQFPENVCEGELAWLSATATGNEPLTYQWTLPDGSNVNDPFLIVFNASSANSGQYRVKVSDPLGCSDSTMLTLQVTPNPRDWFLQDTILFENQYLLAGPAGYASYLWSTGDTMPEITVNTEGLYTLQLTTHNLCAGADSTYLKMLEAESPFLVPNAFTPNNDGLNDTFRPVVDYERVRMFSMVIYNRWGQLIFETTNPADGWDGKDAPSGVYSWVISYSDMVGKVAKMRGSVTLVR